MYAMQSGLANFISQSAHYKFANYWAFRYPKPGIFFSLASPQDANHKKLGLKTANP
jgi:hypothetical protein